MWVIAVEIMKPEFLLLSTIFIPYGATRFLTNIVWEPEQSINMANGT